MEGKPGPLGVTLPRNDEVDRARCADVHLCSRTQEGHKSEASLGYMIPGEVGKMSLWLVVKAKELPQGTTNQTPLREHVAFFALDM